jgi:hypothetical protein
LHRKEGQAGPLHGQDPKRVVHTDTAIVGALGTRETTLWPLVWLVIDIKESVLLLETEPRLDLGALVKDLLGVVAIVGLVGGAVVVVGLCENEDVVSTAEGIPKDGSWTKVDVRIVAGGLVGGRTIKVPNSEVREILHGLGDSLQSFKSVTSSLGRGEAWIGRSRGITARDSVAIPKWGCCEQSDLQWSCSEVHHHRQSRRL